MAGLRRRPPPGATPLPLPGLGEDEPAEAPSSPVPRSAPPFAVQVIRSTRRKRTSAARLVGSTLEIRLPSWMSKAEEARWVAEWTRRFERKLSTDRIDLAERAATLARRHDLPAPTSIRWVDGMRARWGSCTPEAGSVRLSSALARYPDWVVDYVIVHELAHLRQPDHTPAFWALVDRYPRSERARGYLMAKSGDAESQDW